MAQPTNTFDAYDGVGTREDLSDIIYNISPTATPYLSMARRLKAQQILHEWQTDSLTAAAENSVIDGNDAVADAVTPTVRIGVYCQISDVTATVSGTQEVVNKAGRKSEMSYQMAKKAKELKRDMEFILTQEQASRVGTATLSRRTAGIEAWITSNDSRGASGVQGGWSSAGTVATVTDGTQRVFTESLLKNVIQLAWTSGGDPKDIITGPFNKGAFSAFAGIATQYRENKGTNQATIVAGADVYVSNFGEHRIIPSRFSRDRSVLCLDMDYWGVAYLRPFNSFDLSKTGDNDKKQLLVEYANVSLQQAASGIVADLTTS